MEISFNELVKADLIIDCVYKGGISGNISDEPFHKLIPGCENSGGFRKARRKDNSGKYAYVVLYTSMETHGKARACFGRLQVNHGQRE